MHTSVEEMRPTLTITQPAADKGGIEYQRLHQTVPRTAHHAVRLRLLHATHRIGTAINNNDPVQILHNQRRCAGKHRQNHRIHIAGALHLHIGDETGDELLCVRYPLHILRRQFGKKFQHLFQHLILGEAVHAVERSAAAAGGHRPVDEIEAGVHTQLIVQLFHCFLIGQLYPLLSNGVSIDQTGG